MTWNNRLVTYTKVDPWGELHRYYTIVDVYYEADGTASSYKSLINNRIDNLYAGEIGAGGTPQQHFDAYLKRLSRALTLPILDLDHWPHEYKPALYNHRYPVSYNEIKQ